MTSSRITTFSHHYRKKYGELVGKVPVTTGLPCPNRAQGGCIFCRPQGFTPEYLQAENTISSQISQGKRQLLGSRFGKYFGYFQQETCTAAPPQELLSMVERFFADTDCVGVILSTRPDHIRTDLLDPLAEKICEAKKECLFELGLQTSHNRSLKLLNRNHSVEQYFSAADLIKSYGEFTLGCHLIFGIPGETEEMMLQTVKRVCSHGVSALKLHHLQVVRGTALEKMYLDGEVQTMTLERYLNFLVKILPRIPKDVVIHRLWATTHPELLVAPKWHILATHLSDRLRQEMKKAGISQGTGINSTSFHSSMK